MLEFHTLDVFTKDTYAGNPLGVVLGADGLSTAQMQTIAREFNLSETIFVQTPDDPAHTAKVRIFTPAAELPFAGHPTIGCAILLAETLNPRGDFEMEITLEEVAGLVPVMVSRSIGSMHAEFTAPVIPFAHEGSLPTQDVIAKALGLRAEDIGDCGIWQGGPSFIFIRLNSGAALSKAAPNGADWTELTGLANSNAAYLYTPNGTNGFSARMFAPGNGIPEDPATGSASAIFAAQLLHAGELNEGTNRISLTQGIDMGRPSEIALSIDVSDTKITAVRIGGTAVRVSSGSLQPPLPE
jgi:trans-2,3-dihydro-3-hydroxyanthranilate isomerase